MKVARYWTRGAIEMTGPDGRPMRVSATGWSDENLEEARRRAEEAAARMAERIRMGGRPPKKAYGYGERPLREEMVRELHGDDGERIAAVTRNSYGALVLNAARVPFVDIDKKREGLASRLGRKLGAWFGRRESASESEEVGRIIDWAQAHPGYDFRLYETFSGFRLLITNRLIGPTSDDAASLLEGLGSDELYRKLCAQQACYRARLTPKFWRCGAKRPPHRYPWETAEQEEAYRRWEGEYERITARHATCRLIQTIGEGPMPEEARRVVELHDEMTRCESGLPLA